MSSQPRAWTNVRAGRPPTGRWCSSPTLVSGGRGGRLRLAAPDDAARLAPGRPAATRRARGGVEPIGAGLQAATADAPAEGQAVHSLRRAVCIGPGEQRVADAAPAAAIGLRRSGAVRARAPAGAPRRDREAHARGGVREPERDARRDLPSVVKPPADRAGNAGGDRSSDVRAGTGATMSSTALAVASATVSSLPSCSQAQSA